MSDEPHRLTLADGPTGAPRVAPLLEINRLGTAPSSVLLLLVHGYNNEFAEARRAFVAFQAIQRELAQSAEFAPGVKVAQVFWPAGNQPWQFMEVLRRVPAVALAFAETLEAVAAVQQRPLLVNVVAHSLGCRLVLETLRQLQLAGGSRVIFDRLMFFAAAVATELLEAPPDTRQLRATWDAGLHGGARSLYSPADAVLSAAFPIGSTLSGNGEPPMATALGHDHWAQPTRPADLGQAENRGAGHSDYWGGKARTAGTNGRFAGEETRAFLQLPNGPRHTPARHLPDRAQEAREMERRELERRMAAELAMYLP